MGCTINDIVNYAASGEVLNKKDCSLAEAKKVTEKIQHPPKKESPKSFKPTTPAQQLKAVTDPSQRLNFHILYPGLHETEYKILNNFLAEFRPLFSNFFEEDDSDGQLRILSDYMFDWMKTRNADWFVHNLQGFVVNLEKEINSPNYLAKYGNGNFDLRLERLIRAQNGLPVPVMKENTITGGFKKIFLNSPEIPLDLRKKVQKELGWNAQ